MGKPAHVSAPRAAAFLLTVVAVMAACGGTNSVASHSPSPASPSSTQQASPTPTPSQAPKPVTGAYGVLYSSQSANNYTVSIVGVDGKVVASADATTPPAVSCANAAAALVSPPVSMSDSRVYFMDAQGGVRYLAPDGSISHAPIFNLPAGTASRGSMFAVSPDDARIAVVVADFNASGASTKLYVDELKLGGIQNQAIYSETGAFTLWPTGWHGTNNLVVAKVPSCTQGGGPFCCGPIELHVVDPANGNRRFALGTSTCVIAGPPSPAGVGCEDKATFKQATILNWTAGTVRNLDINGPAFIYVSPSGSMVAMVDNTGTSFTIGAATINGMFACTWIDDQHVLSGGDPQHQPRVTDVISGTMVPVASQGDCAGRLPGGL